MKRNAILRRMEQHDEVEKLEDGQLIDAVVEDLYSELDIGSRQSVLLTELLTRFQKAIGLDETPGGITIDGEELWPDVIDSDEDAAHD